MHGGPLGWALFALVGFIGCQDAEPQPTGPPQAEPPSRFDSRTARPIRGTVTWTDALPSMPPFRARINLSLDGLTHLPITRPNPNAPQIDAATRGVGNAVVFLRGIAADQARPWDLPPVRLELKNFGLVLHQGDAVGSVGFVRRGEVLEVVSHDAVFHVLHGRGAAFFGLTLPDTGTVRRPRLEEKGLVELTSGCGYYWMRGHVFVDDHPYYTRTDAQGRFMLPQVPPGQYELVCWLPNWNEARHERDPETALVTRLVFGPPVEVMRSVTVTADGPGPEVRLTISPDDFR
jgi:hypothetical protein